MPPVTKKEGIKVVVQIDSSDDEDTFGMDTTSSTKTPPTTVTQMQQSPAGITASRETLESRSFWKAGAYSVVATSKPASTLGSLEHARVHPKFLHSNATSHKWAFGAIAELMDNAVDEVHNGATFLKVDKIDIKKDNSPALFFLDDGGGMDPEGIRKCMSLGYSSKKSKTTIGQYGNGFKTSTMRLGADVIVFSRATHGRKATQSVGLLSYTYLRRTGQDDVIVPLIDFDISGHWAEPIVYGSQDDWSSNLKTILEWSPFASKEELMQQFEDIGPHGTKIIVYNLWLNDEGIYELSFDDDDEDIRLRDEANSGSTKIHKKTRDLQSHISYRIRYSLRAYASMLYLRKFEGFKIILRGKTVEQFNIADELKHPEVKTYKPQGAKEEATIRTTIGFIKEAPSLAVCGFNVYHKNRLIKPFWKVTPDGSSKGHGVVGVLEANFIEPAHDKQDFERSSLSVRLENKLKQTLMEYWVKHCHIYGYHVPGSRPDNTQKGQPPQSPLGHRPNVLPTVHVETCIDQSIVSLSANVTPNLSNMHTGKDMPSVQSTIQVETVFLNEPPFENNPASASIDEICEENIQLFMRCEEHMRKETELKQTVNELEKELEEAKRKCAQLSSYLETKRKEQGMKPPTGKAS